MLLEVCVDSEKMVVAFGPIMNIMNICFQKPEGGLLLSEKDWF